jgi:hypothetical protein
MTKTWLIVDPASLAAIQTVNASHATDFKDLTPALLTDGRYILSADLLTDDTVNGTWSDYTTILNSLAQSTEDVTDLLPVSPPPGP